VFDAVTGQDVLTLTNTTGSDLSGASTLNLHYNTLFSIPGVGITGAEVQFFNIALVPAGQTATFTATGAGRDTAGVPGPAFAQFIGPGSVGYTWEGAYAFTLNIFPPGLVVNGRQMTAAVTVGVTYTYTAAAVPEPSAVVAPGLVTALGALARAWRRRITG
jgi:hypothetical protein